MALVAWTEARRRVIEAAAELAARVTPRVDDVALTAATGRVLANDLVLDRDQPPFHRSTRDGFAVRAADLAALPARLRRLGEVRAGQAWSGAPVGPGACVEIYTGAPLPEGADAVVMVEDSARDGDVVELRRAVPAGEHVVSRGAEGRRGDLALPRGARLGPPQLALAAALGAHVVPCRAVPRVAVLSTGDEIVPVEATPGPTQIRNSNAVMLAAQVRAAGAEPVLLPRAPDEPEALERALAAALDAADAVVVTGGVSMGQYDLVEPALARLGAQAIFDGVAIRPGKPVTAGRARGKLWFGLPGNPLSAMVTFELFVRPALAVLGGAAPAAGPLVDVALAESWRGKAVELTLFLPARLEASADGRPQAAVLASQGSGDLVGLAHAHGWVVVPNGVAWLPAGAQLGFLPAPT
jgi:molybdopterin molybdotransferase